MQIVFPFVLAMSAILMTAPASADPVAVIKTADLRLDDPRDAAVLRLRVARAIETACGSYAGATFEETGDITACRRTAAAEVRDQVAMIARARGLALSSVR